ncbi:MAG: class I SAM-dependent methyltransferase [Bacteroidota bacterium]
MQFNNPGALIENNWRYSFLKKYFQDHPFQNATLLDLGCGPRPYYTLYEKKFSKTIGADMADMPFPQKAIDIYCAATQVPLPDESVDCILCTEVMQDLQEPSELIKECYRLLKKDGILIITTPYLVPIADGVWDHYRYTQYGLNYLFKKGGFNDLTITPISDVVGAGITLLAKPVLRFWIALSKITRLKFLRLWFNPLLFITVIIPQLLYMILQALPLIKSILKKFSYGPIGYITVAKK